ncbi:MAG: HNH endonuclease signature motif containing protein [Hyphomicrobiales bacterium]
MWSVARPELDIEMTFTTCISKIRNEDLRARMVSITEQIVQAAELYSARAEQEELHLFPQSNDVNGIVSRDEMIDTYDQRLAGNKGPGRGIYDKIKLLPEYGICPFCDHNVVSTLDHILPKTLYPVLSVTPDNLVGCCKDCNKAKLAVAPMIAADVVLHPYFDNITGIPWLTAKVIEGRVAAVAFRPATVNDCSDELNLRIINQFEMLELGRLYSHQAARIISGHQRILSQLYMNGGAEAVRAELARQYDSWVNYRLNCWQAAMYHALSENDWYCEEGHARR